MSKIPKLRFKEFRDDWEEKRLGDYGKLINGLTYSPDNIAEDGLFVLRSSNIQNGQISFHDNVYVDLEVKDEYITKENDILICVRNGSKRLIGKNILISNKLPRATHGAFMTVFRGDSNRLISHWFKSVIYYKEVHKNLGATINSINGSDLVKFKIILPQKQEQEKIASFLISVDTKIEQLTKKETLLQEYKKGVMQKIFNYENRKAKDNSLSLVDSEPEAMCQSTAGGIRFKADDGSEFCEWEEKKLGEVCKFQQGVQVDIELQYKEEKENYIKFIRIENYTQKSEDFRYIPLKLSSNKFITEKEIAIVRYGATAGFIGRGFSGVLANNLFKLILNEKLLDTEYVFYYLNSYKPSKFFQSEIFGGAMPALSFGIVKVLKIPYPSIKEQVKIAKFLSSIDTKIEQTQKALEKTKEFKKALLQQMFV
jgi:type I restriction enzyme, S subunit